MRLEADSYIKKRKADRATEMEQAMKRLNVALLGKSRPGSKFGPRSRQVGTNVVSNEKQLVEALVQNRDWNTLDGLKEIKGRGQIKVRALANSYKDGWVAFKFVFDCK